MPKTMISSQDKKDLDKCADIMADAFIELVEKLKELKINPNVE